MNGTLKFAAAGAAALVVAVVAIAVYFSRPAVVPATSPTPGQSPSVTAAAPTQPAVVPPTDSPTTAPTVTTQPTQAGSKASWVVFLRGAGDPVLFDLWAMRVDGSDAHEILPGLSDQANIAWSQDGSRLLVTDSDATGTSHVYLADVSNLIGSFVDTGFGTGADTACLEKSREPFPCTDWSLSFAPDGERIVLLQTCSMYWPVSRWADSSTSYVSGCDFLTIFDLRTGARTELSEPLRQGIHHGPIRDPAWSPDGSMIAFVRETRQGTAGDSNLYIINADGTNPHMVDLSVSPVAAPQWSPDGTTLVFTSDIDYSMEFGELIHAEDIYTAHADGTDLRQLTTNGLSFGPEWTLSGQIRFRNGNDSLQSFNPYWNTMTFSLMDADGGNPRQYADMESLVRAIDPYGSSGTYAVPGYPSWRQVHGQPSD